MAKIVTITNPLTGQPAQVDQLDHTAQQIDDGLNIARGVSNPNLLDNWYFGNPVDQRQRRVVKPNTTYYSNNTLTTAAGTTSAYATAYRYATDTASGVNYASFKLEDSDTATTYYAAPENVVRGCADDGFGIDRWTKKVLIKDGYITLPKDSYFGQRLEAAVWAAIVGRKVTLSVLYADGTLSIGTKTAQTSVNFFNEKGIYSYFDNSVDGYLILWATADVDIVATKLELGTQQTLAHQDENGNWVLNEIPDYGEQLARCQRHDYIIGRADDAAPVGLGTAYSDTAVIAVIELPEMMRANPTVSITGAINLRFSESKNVSVSSVNNYGFSGDKVQLYIPGLSGLTQGQSCDIYVQRGSKMEFNSNL